MYKGIEEPMPPTDHTTRPPYWNSMCPWGQALEHPAAPMFTEWAQFGCPTKKWQPWTKEEIWDAVDRGPHQSALSKEAIKHFAIEAAEKVHTKQARIVDWDLIKDTPHQIKNITNRGNTTQIQSLQINPWPVVSFATQKWWDSSSRQWHHRENGTKGSDWPNWGKVITHRTRVCRGRWECKNLHGKMGY